MSYEAPRKAKTLIALTAKVVGQDRTVDYKAGKACSVQRNPSNPGEFVIYFKYTRSEAIISKVDAIKITETIQYTDGRDQF